MRNRVYHQQLLGWMKRDRSADVVGEIRTILDFDNRVVAPNNGFKDALDYYRQARPDRCWAQSVGPP